MTLQLKIVFLLTLTLIFNQIVGQTSQNNKKFYKIYIFGNGARHVDSCSVAIDRKYGIIVIGKGCTVWNRLYRRNIKRLIILDKQNGSNWRDKYKQEILKCPNRISVWIDQYKFMKTE